MTETIIKVNWRIVKDDGLPEKDGEYYVKDVDGDYYILVWRGEEWRSDHIMYANVIAWTEKITLG